MLTPLNEPSVASKWVYVNVVCPAKARVLLEKVNNPSKFAPIHPQLACDMVEMRIPRRRLDVSIR